MSFSLTERGCDPHNTSAFHFQIIYSWITHHSLPEKLNVAWRKCLEHIITHYPKSKTSPEENAENILLLRGILHHKPKINTVIKFWNLLPQKHMPCCILVLNYLVLYPFLCAFAKLRKATISFVTSVRLSIHRHEQLGPHWTHSHEILYLSIFRNFVEKFKLRSNLTRITGTLHEDLCTFMIMSRWILLRMRYVSDKSCE
jgi:hypothetical protein